MKNLLKLFGTQSLRLCAITLAAVIAFSFAACGGSSPSDDPDDEDDYVVTFGLVKIDETSFQIEIDGASWKPNSKGGLDLVKLDGIEFFKSGGGQGVINADAGKYASGNDGFNYYFDLENTIGNRDPRIINLTNPPFVGMNGKLTLVVEGNDEWDPDFTIGTSLDFDKYVYRVNPAKASITFTYTAP